MNNDKDPQRSKKTTANRQPPAGQKQNPSPDELPNSSGEERLPDEAITALKQLDQRHPVVPTAVRSAILADATRVLKETKTQPVRSTSTHGRRRWFGISAAVLASAVLLAVMLPQGIQGPNGPAESEIELANSESPSIPVEGDIDGDGRTNILDAFALARSIEGKAESEQLNIVRFDQNGDGLVDTADVRAIAMTVVTL